MPCVLLTWMQPGVTYSSAWSSTRGSFNEAKLSCMNNRVAHSAGTNHAGENWSRCTESSGDEVTSAHLVLRSVATMEHGHWCWNQPFGSAIVWRSLMRFARDAATIAGREESGTSIPAPWRAHARTQKDILFVWCVRSCVGCVGHCGEACRLEAISARLNLGRHWRSEDLKRNRRCSLLNLIPAEARGLPVPRLSSLMISLVLHLCHFWCDWLGSRRWTTSSWTWTFGKLSTEILPWNEWTEWSLSFWGGWTKTRVVRQPKSTVHVWLWWKQNAGRRLRQKTKERSSVPHHPWRPFACWLHCDEHQRSHRTAWPWQRHCDRFSGHQSGTPSRGNETWTLHWAATWTPRVFQEESRASPPTSLREYGMLARISNSRCRRSVRSWCKTWSAPPLRVLNGCTWIALLAPWWWFCHCGYPFRCKMDQWANWSTLHCKRSWDNLGRDIGTRKWWRFFTEFWDGFPTVPTGQRESSMRQTHDIEKFSHSNLGWQTQNEISDESVWEIKITPDTERELQESEATVFRSAVMRLGFLALDRPDIQFGAKEAAWGMGETNCETPTHAEEMCKVPSASKNLDMVLCSTTISAVYPGEVGYRLGRMPTYPTKHKRHIGTFRTAHLVLQQHNAKCLSLCLRWSRNLWSDKSFQ